MKINSNWYFAGFLMVLILFGLFYCDSPEERREAQEEITELAKLAARNSNPEMHKQYFVCYALNPSEKSQCTQALAKKYLNPELERNHLFKTYFQFEAERLGFQGFLKEQGLLCESVIASPVFIEAIKSYLVLCKPNYKYFLEFDYDRKEWKIG